MSAGYGYDFSFRNPRHPHMARGDFMWGGMAVVVSPLVEREHYADEIKILPEHPLVCWLRRLFRFERRPWAIVRGPKMEREQAFIMQGKLFVSPSGWEELKRGAQAAADGGDKR